MSVSSCKPLILIIGSSKLGVEADFHPMLKAYVNLGYQRECSNIFPDCTPRLLASQRTSSSRPTSPGTCSRSGIWRRFLVGI
jgi:hypothetical protein